MIRIGVRSSSTGEVEMQPTSEDYVRVLELICGGTPIHTLRQDYVYELFRRGLLEVSAGDRLQLSAAGQAARENGTAVPRQQPADLAD